MMEQFLHHEVLIRSRRIEHIDEAHKYAPTAGINSRTEDVGMLPRHTLVL